MSVSSDTRLGTQPKTGLLKTRRRFRLWRNIATMAVATVMLAFFGLQQANAQGPDTAATISKLDTIWVLVTGFLVFFMQLGFAILETGMIRQTAATNALLENFLEGIIGAIAWWVVGFGIAYGADNGSGLFGTTLFMPGYDLANVPYGTTTIGTLTMFFFQFAFAATASTITTGAMAERTDFIAHFIYTLIIVGFIYPVAAHWVWGGGWLAQRGFIDFAGSNVVHTVGGVIALVGAWMLGPRKGKVWGQTIPGHNLGLAIIGTMILWLGWYGFNPGSTLGIEADGLAGTVGIVIVNTTLGGAAGTLAALFFQYFRSGKWSLGTSMNGLLAGLVAVTGGCAVLNFGSSLIVGAVGGIVLILWGDMLEKVKIDDAVGASSVHLACGVWGIIAIGLFADAGLTGGPAGLLTGGGVDQLITQLIGSASTIAWVAITSGLMFGALRAINRLRVDAAAEADGNFIDNYEHGESVWPDILPLPGDAVNK